METNGDEIPPLGAIPEWVKKLVDKCGGCDLRFEKETILLKLGPTGALRATDGIKDHDKVGEDLLGEAVKKGIATTDCGGRVVTIYNRAGWKFYYKPSTDHESAIFNEQEETKLRVFSNVKAGDRVPIWSFSQDGAKCFVMGMKLENGVA